MNSKFRKFASVAVAVSAFASSPSVAATASPPATATVTIVRALTLTANQNLDLGTVTIGNTIAGNQTVSLTNAGGLTCGTGTVLTCTGTPKVAAFTVTGASGQVVNVVTAASSLASGANTLTFSPNTQANLTLAAVAGVGTATFNLGGAVTVTGATKDGTYTGNMDVTVNYN